MPGLRGADCGTAGAYEYRRPSNCRFLHRLFRSLHDNLPVYRLGDSVAAYRLRECWCDHRRWLVPLWGNADLAERFLEESNLDAVFPVDALTAANGHDNHWHSSYSLYGVDELPRGMRYFV